MQLSADDVEILLSWWNFIEEVGEDVADSPNEADLVARLRAAHDSGPMTEPSEPALSTEQ